MILPLGGDGGGGSPGWGRPESANSYQCSLLIRRTSGKYYGKVTERFSRCCGAGGQVPARPVLVESVGRCRSILKGVAGGGSSLDVG